MAGPEAGTRGMWSIWDSHILLVVVAGVVCERGKARVKQAGLWVELCTPKKTC